MKRLRSTLALAALGMLLAVNAFASGKGCGITVLKISDGSTNVVDAPVHCLCEKVKLQIEYQITCDSVACSPTQTIDDPEPELPHG